MRREDLTEAAQGIYEGELTSRGLARPASAAEDEEEYPEAAAAAGGGLVSIAKYDSLEEGASSATYFAMKEFRLGLPAN